MSSGAVVKSQGVYGIDRKYILESIHASFIFEAKCTRSPYPLET